jgi:hypothetical protein
MNVDKAAVVVAEIILIISVLIKEAMQKGFNKVSAELGLCSLHFYNTKVS